MKIKENEQKAIMALADMIEGEINRMCVTHDLSELEAMHDFAKSNLDKLLKLKYKMI